MEGGTKMPRLFERTGILIVLCFLIVSSNEAGLTRTLRGTIKDGRYIAPDNQFSFPVHPNAKVEDRLKVISVSRFYERAFDPVPSSIEIPRTADWLTVSFRDSCGLSDEICSMPITGDSFTPLSPALHRRTVQRFLQDVALPEWRSSVSEESWLADDIEYLKLEGTDILIATLLVPRVGIKGVTWKPEGAKFHLH
jgi:hypothetical protein